MDMEVSYFISNFFQDINTKQHSIEIWHSDTVFNCEIEFSKSKLQLYFEGDREGSYSYVKTIIHHNVFTSYGITYIFHPHGLYEVTVKGGCDGFGIFKILLHLYKTDDNVLGLKGCCGKSFTLTKFNKQIRLHKIILKRKKTINVLSSLLAYANR